MLSWPCLRAECFKTHCADEGYKCDTVGRMQVLPRGMAADVHKKKGWEVPNGSLAPGDGQHTERSESPTPGLAQGTEPGMGLSLLQG